MAAAIYASFFDENRNRLEILLGDIGKYIYILNPAICSVLVVGGFCNLEWVVLDLP